MATGDFDGDGLPDLAVTDRADLDLPVDVPGRVLLYRNQVGQ